MHVSTVISLTLLRLFRSPQRHPGLSGGRGGTRHGARRDYTFAHAGRQVRLGPVAFWVVVGTLVIMALWTITTGTYFAFRDDVLTRLIARQANMQFGYEDRIAELRAQIDRISSRQLLDQELYEQKLEQILQRQATLESRASAVGGLPDPTDDRIDQADRQERRRGAHSAAQAGSDKGAFLLQSTRRPSCSISCPRRPRKSAGNFDDKLARLQASLDRVEQSQGSTLSSLEESLEYKARRMRGVLVDLGFEKGKGSEVQGRRHRRTVPAGQIGERSRRLRPPAVAHPARPRQCRAADAHAQQPAGPQAAVRRTRDRVEFRRPQRSVHPLGRDAHRARLSERTRCAGARHRQRHGDLRGLERRLRQGDRCRSRQRLRRPATVTSRPSR